MDNRNIRTCRKALAHFKIKRQEEVLISDMSDLSKTIMDYRNGSSFESPDTIAEKIANIEIVLEQVKTHYRIHRMVGKWTDSKCRRIDRLLEGDENGQN